MTGTLNPYHWDGHRPTHEVARPALLARARELAVSGKSGILLGARGTGKSVFLAQVQRELESVEGITVIRFNAPPPNPAVENCLRELSDRLGIAAGEDDDAETLVRQWARSSPQHRMLVLLYDEADQYARTAPGSGRALFNDLEAARRELTPTLAVIVAGGLGLYMLRDTIGSPFTSRAEWLTLAPFDENDLDALMAPFDGASRRLPQEVSLSLLLTAGGNPALLTYGLERLWEIANPTEISVATIFAEFRERHSDFLKSFERSFADPDVSTVPMAVWKIANTTVSPIPRAMLLEVSTDEGPAKLNLDDALLVLKAAGLVRIVGSALADPLEVHPLSTLVNIPEQIGGIEATFRSRLLQDALTLLSHVHSFGVDFYRSSRGDATKTLVPESVFSAVLAVGLRTMGWIVEREAVSAAGRTDLKISHPALDGQAILELKIWGRNNYRDIQRQVLAYFSAATTVGLAVMLTDSDLVNWGESYKREVLGGVIACSEHSAARPISGHFTATISAANGVNIDIDHLLVRVPRR